jgi:hypothetical protein
MAGDRGVEIGRLARALTRDQFAEMLAIALHRARTKYPSKICAFHYSGHVLGPLVRDGLVAPTPKKIGKRSMHSNRLTELGWSVFLSRAEKEIPWALFPSACEAA